MAWIGRRLKDHLVPNMDEVSKGVGRVPWEQQARGAMLSAGTQLRTHNSHRCDLLFQIGNKSPLSKLQVNTARDEKEKNNLCNCSVVITMQKTRALVIFSPWCW